MFSMDIEEFIERGRQGDEDALGDHRDGLSP